MGHSAIYFPNTSNAVFNDVTITHISGSAHFSNPEGTGLRLLLDNISREAFHDAAERGDPPKCHPHTRVAIREEIMEWIKTPEAMRKLILWMYGPAGSGKTAIAQSIAEECEKRGLLSASFFFGRTAAGRNDTTRVVATIAFQISRFLPQIKHRLFTAIEQDPTIFSRTLTTQMQVLVVEPLNSVLADRPIFVILDGLDESGPNTRAQADLLNALGTAISALQHIPLIFLISSRPEYEICRAFDGPLLQSFVRPLSLDNHYNPNTDIKLYFDSAFRQIHDKNLRLGIHLPSPWPFPSDVDLLVSKTSGQFICAETVIKFVNSVGHNPTERLDIILGLSDVGDEKPFGLLDALYYHILSSAVNLPKVLEILTLLLLSPTIGSEHVTLTVEMIGELLSTDVRGALVDMHALVFVPLPADGYCAVRIHHASLYDFLTDQSRSHDYYIDKIQGHITLSRRWLRVIGNRPISIEFSLIKCVASFNYHCRNSPVGCKIADDLVHFNLRASLEEMFPKFKEEMLKAEWKEFFDCVKRQVKVPGRNFLVCVTQRVGERVHVLARLQGEFLAYFIARLSKYPPGLQASVPAILSLSARIPSANAFHALLYAVCQSQEELNESRELDSTLLRLYNLHQCDDILRHLFEDRVLSGHYYVDSGSYLTLAKQIVNIIFPKLGGGGQNGKFQHTYCIFHDPSQHSTSTLRHVDVTFKYWFKEMLSRASVDLHLARFLRYHALQYKNDVYPEISRGETEIIAMASLAYVQRCGLPYLKHTHLQGTDGCIVCEKYGVASAVVDSQSYLNIFDELVSLVQALLNVRACAWGCVLCMIVLAWGTMAVISGLACIHGTSILSKTYRM